MGNARSGDFSQDPQFDPDALFQIVTAAENDSNAVAALQTFLASNDAAGFARAIALYVRSAHARGLPIEQTLAGVNRILDVTEGAKTRPAEVDPPRARQIVMHGLLLAYYGQDVVDTNATEREQRRVDRFDTDAAEESPYRLDDLETKPPASSRR